MKTQNKKLIIHIALDEKFIDTAYDIYEKAFPNINSFLILRRPEEDIKYLNKIDKYRFVQTNTNFIKTIEEYTSSARIVIFHGMSDIQALVVKKLRKKSKKYVWVPFGTEVYNNKYIVKNLSISPITYKSFVFSKKKWIKEILRPAYYLLLKGEKSPKLRIKKSFMKMDYITILYEEELWNYMKLGIVNPHIEFVKFTYYPIDIVINANSDFVNGRNILLGNSASYTNNHLEVFEILKKFDLKEFSIITPLSYGKKDYANKIINLGNEFFGDRFQPITDFKPLREYHKILQCCGVAIMNHSRTQATGNIITLLFLGSKIFLSKETTIFHYLKRIGCFVFSIEHDLDFENKETLNLLSKDQMLHNRAILNKELSLDKLVNELREKLTPVLYH